jgi:hypothetical protein
MSLNERNILSRWDGSPFRRIRLGFVLAAAGCRGGGKAGILLLDFHFSIAPMSTSSSCWF